MPKECICSPLPEPSNEECPQHGEPVRLCYWIVGAKLAPAIAPCVCMDLHLANGDLLGETYSEEMPSYGRGREARLRALRYARKHGIPRSNVYHDTDSTQFFANC